MRSISVAFLALMIAGCDREITINLPTEPTPTTPAVVRSTIEFRVIGNPTSVRVRYSTPTDGLTQVVTTLPYSTAFTTVVDSMFLSLEVTPIAYSLITNYPFLSIQIVANGALFREATSNEFILNTLQVNGTWRRQ
jgi:hypothetical protein